MNKFALKDLRKIEFDIGVAVPTRCLMAWLVGDSRIKVIFLKGTFKKKGSSKTATVESVLTNSMTLSEERSCKNLIILG